MSDHTSMSTKNSPPAHDTPSFDLPYLPAELQDMIFRHCLASGNPQVLRLSKNIKKRLQFSLYRDAHLHLDSGDVQERGDATRLYSIPSRISTLKTSLIQNITIHITDQNLGKTKSESNPQTLIPLPVIDFAQHPWTCITQRRTLHLSFSQQDTTIHFEEETFGKLIKGLTTFEVVTVTAITTPPERKRKEYQPFPIIFRARNKPVYETIRRVWERELGPAKFYNSLRQEGGYLEFRPPAYLA